MSDHMQFWVILAIYIASVMAVYGLLKWLRHG